MYIKDSIEMWADKTNAIFESEEDGGGKDVFVIFVWGKGFVGTDGGYVIENGEVTGKDGDWVKWFSKDEAVNAAEQLGKKGEFPSIMEWVA